MTTEERDQPVEPTKPSDIGSRIRQFREEMGWSMAELAKELGVSKSTIYRAEKGKQVFNYKLLFWLVVRGMNPDWLLFGGTHGVTRWEAEMELLAGHTIKAKPESMRDLGRHFEAGKRWLYFPTEPNEELVRVIRKVEALFVQGDEFQRKALFELLDALERVRSSKSPTKEAESP